MVEEDENQSTEQKVRNLIEEVKEGNSVEITTKDDVREYLDINRRYSRIIDDQQGLPLTQAAGRNRTGGYINRLIDLGDGEFVRLKGAMFDEEHGTTYHIKEAGEVEIEAWGIDKQAFVDECPIDGIDDSHAETIDQHISGKVSESVAIAEVWAGYDGNRVYMTTEDSAFLVNTDLRRKLDYDFDGHNDPEWDELRSLVLNNIKTNNYPESAPATVEMVAEVDFKH